MVFRRGGGTAPPKTKPMLWCVRVHVMAACGVALFTAGVVFGVRTQAMVHRTELALQEALGSASRHEAAVADRERELDAANHQHRVAVQTAKRCVAACEALVVPQPSCFVTTCLCVCVCVLLVLPVSENASLPPWPTSTTDDSPAKCSVDGRATPRP